MVTGGSGGLEFEDSLGPEFRALLDGGALRDGLGCGGEGGMEPTQVWYLLGATAVTAKVGPMARML